MSFYQSVTATFISTIVNLWLAVLVQTTYEDSLPFCTVYASKASHVQIKMELTRLLTKRAN